MIWGVVHLPCRECGSCKKGGDHPTGSHDCAQPHGRRSCPSRTLLRSFLQVAKFPFKGNTSFVAIVPRFPLRKNFSQLLSEVLQRDLQASFPKERPTMVKMPKLHLEDHVDLNGALTRLGEGRPDSGRKGVSSSPPPCSSPLSKRRKGAGRLCR